MRGRTDVFALLLAVVVASQLSLTCCKPVADLERNGVASNHHRKGQDVWQWRVERILRRIERVLDEDDYPSDEEALGEQAPAEDHLYGWVEPSEVELPSKPFGQAIRDLLPKTAEDEPDFTEDWYSALADSMNWDFDESDSAKDNRANDVLHSRKHHK
ncbi:uncharacterized protein LOC118410375 [Branchiostoma floridae]|uniref:Uncharacterized protein LOC118410375 n=1 Tax=Branchiostoma floridae TaxID=7739 RepID=C3Z6A6_BRAFL|nr:uncharacterized protein LOC118410375 [Branchiostoma floridae]|eukprot:XP_002595929.1 hypothetical protein BRAFLDRAFT_128654 [Branchiostoma floridae]